VVEDNGEPCTCGRNGCLRTVVGSKVAVKHARQIAERDPQSIYHHLVDSLEDITVDVVLEAYNAGDEATLALIKEVGFHLGKAVAHLVGALNIHRIIITGSMARFGRDFTNAIQKEVSQRVLPALANEIQIEPSSLGQDTVALGAAALLLANELALH
jgi:predicted NBD/HSP70 family sugar kinase